MLFLGQDCFAACLTANMTRFLASRRLSCQSRLVNCHLVSYVAYVLQYAHMCHFYANPLSVLIPSFSKPAALQAEHIEALRHVSSFQEHVEAAVESESVEELQYAQNLLRDDAFLVSRAQESISNRQEMMGDFLRALLIVQATEGQDSRFSEAFVDAMEEGIAITEGSRIMESVQRLDITELMTMVRRIVSVLQQGDVDLCLGPATKQGQCEMRDALIVHLIELEELNSRAEQQSITLRSKYSGQGKVLRTTVIAQRVQLSHDSAALTEEDKQLTRIVDEITALLMANVRAPKPGSLLLSESWLYDSRAPSRDVFVPRPRTVLERSLTRPHDYLSCACCKPGEESGKTKLPATALLYRLYIETGSQINVADLWSAFTGLVGDGEGEGEGEDGTDERKTLVVFYQALAELRALGFVKASKKKADHIAKLKWL